MSIAYQRPLLVSGHYLFHVLLVRVVNLDDLPLLVRGRVLLLLLLVVATCPPY